MGDSVEDNLENAHRRLARLGIMKIPDTTAHLLRRAPRVTIDNRWLVGYKLGSTLTMTAVYLHEFATQPDHGARVFRFMTMPDGLSTEKPLEQYSRVVEIASDASVNYQDEFVQLQGCLVDEFGYAYHEGIDAGIGYSLDRFGAAWSNWRMTEIERLAGKVTIPADITAIVNPDVY